MITSKKELKIYLEKDLARYSFVNRKSHAFAKDNDFLLKKFIILLRKCEYFYNSKKFFAYLLCKRRKNKLAHLLCLEIPINVFGPGLLIYHGTIVVNSSCSIGENCSLHGMNCIGNKGTSDTSCPVIGDNCEFGVGVNIIGGVKIGNNVIVSANSLVNKDIPSNTIAGGVPASVLKNKMED